MLQGSHADKRQATGSPIPPGHSCARETEHKQSHDIIQTLSKVEVVMTRLFDTNSSNDLGSG